MNLLLQNWGLISDLIFKFNQMAHFFNKPITPQKGNCSLIKNPSMLNGAPQNPSYA